MYTVINGISDHSLKLAFDLLSMEAKVLILDTRENALDDLPNDLNEEILNHNFNQKLKTKSFEELFQELFKIGIYRPARHVRFGKKYLLENEMQESRMKDLFRVISFAQASVREKELPFEGASEKLTKDFQASLEMAREDFEDCDFFVSDESSVQLHKNYPTVNLEILSSDENIKFANESTKDEIFKSNQVTIVGDSIEAAQLILNNQEWFFDLSHHLDLVCSGDRPFEAIKDTEEHKKIMSFLNRLEVFLNKSFEEYRDYVFERRSQKLPLDRKEPRETISFFLGYRALVLDKLYDRDDYYLTLEKPSFDGQAELKTVAADEVFFLMDTSCHSPENISEEGVYFLNKSENVEHESTRVIESMMRYFSRND